VYIFNEQLVESFVEVVKNAVGNIFDGNGVVEFQRVLKDGLNEIATEIQKEVFEAIDAEFVEKKASRKGWVIKHRNRKKTVLSPFGQVTYARTGFANKKTGKYAYLTDRFLGYKAHQRLDLALEAELVDAASEMSFRKAGQEAEKRAVGTQVSGQTVLNLVRKLRPEELEKVPPVVEKKSCRVLYIDADEDHVAGQDGKSFEVKLINVHEGRTRVNGKRFRLKEKQYFVEGHNNRVTSLWEQVWRYIQATYILEDIEHIFISGDGASWIKSGVDYLPNSIFVLDRFHLQQCITRAAGGNKELHSDLKKAVWGLERSKILSLLREEHGKAETDSRKRTIENCYKYLANNWNGIKVYRDYGAYIVGCSAEGQVSHILSSRLSSRPMGWSRIGAHQIAHLRVHKANGSDVSQLYLHRRLQENEKSTQFQVPDSIKHKKVVGDWFEALDNVPIIRGKVSSFGPVLRQISNGNILW
jgi:hypothetical protein